MCEQFFHFFEGVMPSSSVAGNGLSFELRLPRVCGLHRRSHQRWWSKSSLGMPRGRPSKPKSDHHFEATGCCWVGHRIGLAGSPNITEGLLIEFYITDFTVDCMFWKATIFKPWSCRNFNISPQVEAKQLPCTDGLLFSCTVQDPQGSHAGEHHLEIGFPCQLGRSFQPKIELADSSCLNDLFLYCLGFQTASTSTK